MYAIVLVEGSALSDSSNNEATRWTYITMYTIKFHRIKIYGQLISERFDDMFGIYRKTRVVVEPII